MTQKTSTPKATRLSSKESARSSSAGAQGAAVDPPAYGIAALDSGAIFQYKAASAGKTAPGAALPYQAGLPDALKSSIESLSGLSLEDVRVHYNSPRPAQLQALAFTQGTEIYVAPGEERHLPHEAWHVVQQAQGRVRPTMQMKGGVPVNDDAGLEHEADVMGAKALRNPLQPLSPGKKPLQAKFDTLQLVLRNPNDAAREGQLVGEYHAAEDDGDACSIGSNDPEVHRTAITHFQRAKRLRKQASNLHVTPDRGHLTAIDTLSDKIAVRRQKITALTTPRVRRPAAVVAPVNNNVPREPMGTASQASWLPGNQPAWFPRPFGT